MITSPSNAAMTAVSASVGRDRRSSNSVSVVMSMFVLWLCRVIGRGITNPLDQSCGNFVLRWRHRHAQVVADTRCLKARADSARGFFSLAAEHFFGLGILGIKHQGGTRTQSAKKILKIKILKRAKQNLAGWLSVHLNLKEVRIRNRHAFNCDTRDTLIKRGGEDCNHASPAPAYQHGIPEIDISAGRRVLDQMQCIPDAHSQQRPAQEPSSVGEVGVPAIARMKAVHPRIRYLRAWHRLPEPPYVRHKYVPTKPGQGLEDLRIICRSVPITQIEDSGATSCFRLRTEEAGGHDYSRLDIKHDSLNDHAVASILPGGAGVDLHCCFIEAQSRTNFLTQLAG